MAYSLDELKELYTSTRDRQKRAYYKRRLKALGMSESEIKKLLHSRKPEKEPEPELPKETVNGDDIIKNKKDWTEVVKFDKPVRIGIFGLQGSGKTTLAKDIAREQKKHTFIFDVMHEYPFNHRYKVKNRSYPEIAQEFDLFYKNFYKPKVLEKKIKNILIIDEANRIAPNGRKLAEGLAELNDLHRHYRNSFVLIARRPAQLHTDLLELLHYIIVFRLNGINDIKRLNSIKEGLGDKVKQLGEHEFIIYDVIKDDIYYSKLDI